LVVPKICLSAGCADFQGVFKFSVTLLDQKLGHVKKVDPLWLTASKLTSRIMNTTSMVLSTVRSIYSDHGGYGRTHLICSTVMSTTMSTIGTVMVRRASAALKTLPASFDACRLSDNVCTREAVPWQIRHHPMGLTAVRYEPAIAGCATIPVGQL
jgi:hypothetical protein